MIIKFSGVYRVFCRKTSFREDIEAMYEFYRDIREGKIKAISKGKNLITNTGREIIRNVLAGSYYFVSDIYYGNGDAPPSPSDTWLKGDKVYRADYVNTFQRDGFSVDIVGYIPYRKGNDLVIREIGIRESTTLGLFSRSLLNTPVVKTAEQDMVIIYTLSVSSS